MPQGGERPRHPEERQGLRRAMVKVLINKDLHQSDTVVLSPHQYKRSSGPVCCGDRLAFVSRPLLFTTPIRTHPYCIGKPSNPLRCGSECVLSYGRSVDLVPSYISSTCAPGPQHCHAQLWQWFSRTAFCRRSQSAFRNCHYIHGIAAEHQARYECSTLVVSGG
jgi:hypothetical protein